MTRLWKNGNWNDEQLKHALRVINGQSRVLMASMEFCIMVSILRKHFFGTTIGKKGGGGGSAHPNRGDCEICEKMASIAYPMSLAQLRVIMAEIIQECPTP